MPRGLHPAGAQQRCHHRGARPQQEARRHPGVGRGEEPSCGHDAGNGHPSKQTGSPRFLPRSRRVCAAWQSPAACGGCAHRWGASPSVSMPFWAPRLTMHSVTGLRWSVGPTASLPSKPVMGYPQVAGSVRACTDTAPAPAPHPNRHRVISDRAHGASRARMPISSMNVS